MKDKLFTNQQLKALILPLIVEQFLAILVGAMDTIMVSSCGEAAISGLSLVDGINILLINIFAALATGGAVVASQYLGKNEKDNACESIKQLMYTMLVISSVLMILCVIFKYQLLSLIFGNVANDVMNNAQIYFTISSLSYPFIALYNCGAASFRAMGNSKISMMSSLLMNGLNIAGNALLIYVFNMGVAGAAISSLISRMIGCLLILKMLKNRELKIYIDSYLNYHPQLSMVKKILNIGVPNGLENGMFQFGKILVQRIVTTFGTIGISAYAVAGNINSFMIIPSAAVGLAMITVVGRCVGANDYEQAKYYIKKLMKLSYLVMFIWVSIVLLSLNGILELYNLKQATLNMTILCVFIHGIGGILVWPLAFTFPNALRASNDAAYTMKTSIFSMFAFRLILAYLLITYFNLGLEYIFVAMVIDWIFRSMSFLYRYYSGKWMNRKLV